MLKYKKEMQISQMLRSFYPQPYLFYVDALTLYGLFYIRLNSSYIVECSLNIYSTISY